jgi:arylsulfatase A-like enzyme
MRSPHAHSIAILLALIPALLLAACKPGGCEPGGDEGAREIAPGLSHSPPRVVVLISLDTLRPDHLGTYGHVRDTSPVLDALADRGVVFEDASSTAPWTLPAHASMLTGLYPSQAKVRRSPDRLPASVPTLAAQFRDAGYRTVGIATSLWFSIGKFSQGFDEWEALDDEAADILRGIVPAKKQTAEGLSERITLLALKTLDSNWRRSVFSFRKGPVFLFLHYFDIHSDYVSRPEFENIFLPSDFRSESRVDGSTEQLDRIEAGAMVLNDLEREQLRTLYDAGIRQLDHRLKPLFDWIEQEVGWEQALVVVTSDHGEAFFEHDSNVKHGNSHYQEEIRVPLIMVGGKLPAGLRVSDPVSLVDIAPTLLGAAGITAANPLPGIDLARHWQQADAPGSAREIYAQSAPAVDQDWLRAVRRGRYKLIINMKLQTRELYDLSADPAETRNLAKALPDVTRELAALLDEFERSDPDPERKPEFEIDEATRERLRALGYTEQE